MAKCEICKAEYTQHRSTQRLCGREECKKIDHVARNRRYLDRKLGIAVVEDCLFCGQPFVPRQPGGAYCSRDQCLRDRKRISMAKWRQAQAEKTGKKRKPRKVTKADCVNMT